MVCFALSFQQNGNIVPKGVRPTRSSIFSMQQIGRHSRDSSLALSGMSRCVLHCAQKLIIQQKILNSDEQRNFLKELEIFRSSGNVTQASADDHSVFVSLEPEINYFCPPEKFDEFSFSDLIKRDSPYDQLLLLFLGIQTLQPTGNY